MSRLRSQREKNMPVWRCDLKDLPFRLKRDAIFGMQIARQIRGPGGDANAAEVPCDIFRVELLVGPAGTQEIVIAGGTQESAEHACQGACLQAGATNIGSVWPRTVGPRWPTDTAGGADFGSAASAVGGWRPSGSAPGKQEAPPAQAPARAEAGPPTQEALPRGPRVGAQGAFAELAPICGRRCRARGAARGGKWKSRMRLRLMRCPEYGASMAIEVDFRAGRIIQLKQTHYEPTPEGYSPLPLSLLANGHIRRTLKAGTQDANRLVSQVDWERYKCDVTGVRWHAVGAWRVQFDRKDYEHNFFVKCSCYFRVSIYGFDRAKDQVIGHVSYVIELQETNLQRSREVTTEILKVLEAQMDTLKASKLQLTTCLTRSAMVKAQTTQEIYMVAENIRTIEAHGTLKYQSELPLIWPSAKDYMKPQADETKNMKDIEFKLRVARREEIAKDQHKEIFDVVASCRELRDGRQALEGGNPAWGKNKPETRHAYGWKGYEVWPDYDSVNTSQAQMPEMPEKLEDTWPPPVGYAKRKMELGNHRVVMWIVHNGGDYMYWNIWSVLMVYSHSN
ncbi:unnamed protein product [Prorocentrum cordatum]|uniref:Uncharacterized protein n=1 Tax=Prorocentrum cordatum TaxID=2364126 RepID=A0ABN9SAE7_9DINO|nr:unnamed protein product [Polarella glacialis]